MEVNGYAHKSSLYCVVLSKRGVIEKVKGSDRLEDIVKVLVELNSHVSWGVVGI